MFNFNKTHSPITTKHYLSKLPLYPPEITSNSPKITLNPNRINNRSYQLHTLESRTHKAPNLKRAKPKNSFFACNSNNVFPIIEHFLLGESAANSTKTGDSLHFLAAYLYNAQFARRALPLFLSVDLVFFSRWVLTFVWLVGLGWILGKDVNVKMNFWLIWGNLKAIKRF